MKFLHDLRRRRMFRLVGLYIVGAWVVIQVAEALFQAWGVPETANRFVFIAAALCFPIALVFGWIYDITPQGIVRTADAAPGESVDMRLRRKDYLILTALLVVGIAILGKSATDIAEEIDDSAETLARLEKSVAVLPFDSLDLNAETAVFSDGVSAEILHRLSTLRLLNVIAAPSSFALRNSNESMAQIARILGVRYLLQGNVRRDSDTVRITANLLDETGRQVWSKTFDRKLEGILAIQSEIASTVSSEILNEIVPLQDLPAGRTTANIDAYNEYLIGKAFVTTRTPGWQQDAAAAFRRSIAIDDGFAPAHAGLAIALYVASFGENLDEVAARANRALELDPDLAEANAILGLYLHEIEGRSDTAIEHLRRAIYLDPSFSHAYNWLAIVFNETGREDESREIQERGLAIDPVNAPLVANVAARIANEGDPDRARNMVKRLAYLPETPGLAFWTMIDIENSFGRLDEAALWATKAARAYAATQDARAFAALAFTLSRLGMVEEAEHWMSVYQREESDSMDRAFSQIYWLRLQGDFDGFFNAIQAAGMPPEPAWPSLSVFQASVFATSYLSVGDYETTIAIMEAPGEPSIERFMMEMSPKDAVDFLHGLAIAYREAGQAGKSLALLEDIERTLSSPERFWQDNPKIALRLAHNAAIRGETQETLDRLQHAYDVGWIDHNWITTDPTWGDVFQHPDFQRILGEMKDETDRQRAHFESVHDAAAFRTEMELLLSR